MIAVGAPRYLGVPTAISYRVGTRDRKPFAAQWLACVLPCRRFTASLARGGARLGADADRYAFIAVDFHHLLLAGLPGAQRTTLNELCGEACNNVAFSVSYEIRVIGACELE